MAGEIYFNNLTGKFDWGSIIDQIIKLKSLPIQRLSQEAQQIQAKQDALSKLSQAVSDFSKLFESLNTADLFKGKKAVSSDSSVLTASAGENTPNVSLNITVDKLAQKEVIITTGAFSDPNQTINWSNFTMYYATATAVEPFNIPAGSGTLQDLVNTINTYAGSRINAGIFYDGTYYRLMLAEKDESASTVETSDTGTVIFYSGFTINGEAQYIVFPPLQKAQNAQITIGSTTITSPSNTFENVISGLSISVNKTGSATISVSDDYSKVVNFFNDFVKKYNAVVSQVNKLTDKDAIFQGDYTVVGIKTELSRMLDDLFRYDLVNIKEDGTLEANTSAINSMAGSNPGRLKEVIDNLKENMGGYLLRTSTSLQGFLNDYQSRIDQLSVRARMLQEQLVKEEERLRLEYAKVEAFMNKAQDIMNRLQAFIVSLSEMQGGKK